MSYMITWLYIWDAQSGKPEKTLEGHLGELFSVAHSSDGSKIISGSNDKRIRIWDAQSFK